MEAFLAWYAAVILRLRAVWERIPKWLRTIINVCVGAGIAAVVKEWVAGETDTAALIDVFLVAAGTMLWRMINPVDASYGLGGGKIVLGPGDVAELDTPGELGDTSADETGEAF